MIRWQILTISSLLILVGASAQAAVLCQELFMNPLQLKISTMSPNAYYSPKGGQVRTAHVIQIDGEHALISVYRSWWEGSRSEEFWVPVMDLHKMEQWQPFDYETSRLQRLLKRNTPDFVTAYGWEPSVLFGVWDNGKEKRTVIIEALDGDFVLVSQTWGGMGLIVSRPKRDQVQIWKRGYR